MIPPAAERNAAPILAVVRDLLNAHVPAPATVLEIASGSGHHARVFANALPDYTFQPTEADAHGCATIAALHAPLQLPNLRPPAVLDVTQRPWAMTTADAVICINMIHIAPWAATEALFAGTAAILPVGGLVITYGPYAFDGDHGAESNRTFDASLRARNPAWGVRDVRDIDACAAACGFAELGRFSMPANNHVLAYRKRDP
jgi:hypothetical protein